MLLVRTATLDFTDDEIRATTRALGQVYADVSAKLAPDDFARDLRKLRPARDCAAPPDPTEREGGDDCPGCWEAVPGDPFTRDDGRVMEILRALSGRVLDVGGGEGTYLSALAPRAAQIDYHCVDPDAGRLALLAVRHPWARFSVGVAEELPAELGTFDHVLFLRSYNHLAEPARALARALALLGPRGSLTLVDNVAFGLVRTAAQAARAEAAPANKLEHYRNDDAGQADLAVQEAAREAGRTLRLVERRDVGPETSNQWLLRYE
jgi:SAM-dependent methyltransferase